MEWRDVLHDGPRPPLEVHARVPTAVEAGVLRGDGGIDHILRHLLEGNGVVQAPEGIDVLVQVFAVTVVGDAGADSGVGDRLLRGRGGGGGGGGEEGDADAGPRAAAGG